MNAVTDKPAVTINYQPCQSSQIAAYGYDEATQTLGVKFVAGGTYHYHAVPQSVFAEMILAPSVGSFFGARIRKGGFEYARQPESEGGIVFGLSQEQEPKYTVSSKTGRLTNRSTGHPIPDDEPVFVIRAKDINSIPALEHYRQLCSNPDHKAVIKSRIQDFRAFQDKNSKRVREPDSSLQDISRANVGREPFKAAA